MLKYLLVFLLVINTTPLFAQEFDNDYQTQFAWEVKQINEFIERFNNSDANLSKFLKKSDPLKVPTRDLLIKSLFNYQQKDWNVNDINSFIVYASNTDKPQFLDFYGDNWNARVNCAVIWKGKPENVQLTLKLQHLSNNGYKWIIVDAAAPFLKEIVANKPAGSQPFHMPLALDSTSALSPMSHATDFMRISQVSEDRNNIANYFQDPDKCSAETQQFVQECISARLKIKNALAVTYCFMQIKGWDIDIQQYNRSTNNSGWLISKLTKTALADN